MLVCQQRIRRMGWHTSMAQGALFRRNSCFEPTFRSHRGPILGVSDRMKPRPGKKWLGEGLHAEDAGTAS